MDSDKKYSAYRVPQRSETDTPATQTGHGTITGNHRLAQPQFAEVEFQEGIRGGAVVRSQPASIPSSFSQRYKETRDPVSQAFHNMRKLAAGSPYFAYRDQKTFYDQAKYMAAFTDDYDEKEELIQYYPDYQHLYQAQLRTYFTWRTSVRNGIFSRVSVSYIFLYIYELLHRIGAADSADGLDKLLYVWNSYRECEPTLDRYLPGWIKDYHIYYPLPHSFDDFVFEHDLARFYPDMYLLDERVIDRLTLWNSLSSYDITKSKFYQSEGKELLHGCFNDVIGAVGQLCNSHNTDILNVFCPGRISSYTWTPFQGALFYSYLAHPSRKVDLTDRESYTCKHLTWTATRFTYEIRRRDLIGYLLRHSESCLRQTVKFKYKLQVNNDVFCSGLNEPPVRLQELDETIRRAVADFYAETKRIHVTVNPVNLAAIRIQAQGTQQRLTVPEDNEHAVLFLDSIQEESSVQQTGDPVPGTVEARWLRLKQALNATELAALSLILDGTGDIKAFADKHGIMLEVLLDGINGKAADLIGDSLLDTDNNIAVYEEYRQSVAEMVG